jgi:hypothetical protein
MERTITRMPGPRALCTNTFPSLAPLLFLLLHSLLFVARWPARSGFLFVTFPAPDDTGPLGSPAFHLHAFSLDNYFFKMHALGTHLL